MNRVEAVERQLDGYLEHALAPDPGSLGRKLAPSDPLRPGSSLTAREALELFEDQVLSRALDVEARELKKDGRSVYTISSAGHEQNAVIGKLLRPTDPCFLHYRSGGLMAARLRKRDGSTPCFDTLLSLCASSEDPVSGGRHKVWGSAELGVPPQTSTIASHLPKAVGTAFALSRARRLGLKSRLGLERELPHDSVVLCSFGDASANHATALAGINAARYSARKGNPTPILFLCEDNRVGISVPTPATWIQDIFSGNKHLHYFEAKGDLASVWETAKLAITTCRSTHVPTFLHLRTVRLLGHAGSDVETTYRTLGEIESIEAEDPLLANAQLLVESGAATPGELRALIADTRARVRAAAREASRRPRLERREQVLEPLAPYDVQRTRDAAETAPNASRRQQLWGERLPEQRQSPAQRNLAAHVNAALFDLMIEHPEILIFGEDVGKKGGVYGVTKGLQQTFSEARVFDTLLDETTILGVAQGAGQLGFLPMPEIQYLAYVHNALDQLRGEACSLSFFSKGAFTNPMVVRIAGLAYQKGFGGHFHNDNSIGALRDIPGLAIACPSRGDEAAKLLRGCTALAQTNGRVVVFLEPIALYHERDLHEEGDGGWLCDYPEPGQALLPGEVGVHGAEATDLLIVSYANGLRLSLRAARRLEQETGKRARVVDLRWLAPLAHEALRAHATECGRVLVVDECRRTGGGVAEAVIADLAQTTPGLKLASVCAADSYVPLGSATEAVLVTEDQILAGAKEVLS